MFKDVLLPAVISFVFLGVGGGIFKYFVKKTFDNLSERVATLEKSKLITQEACITRMEVAKTTALALGLAEKDIVRLQESIKVLHTLQDQVHTLDQICAKFPEKFLPKGDFIREVQLLTSLIESIFRKIDNLDSKLP